MYLARSKLFDATRFASKLARARKPLNHFKKAITHGRAVLKHYHYQGANAPDLIAAHAWLVDQVLSAAWNHLKPAGSGSNQGALVAVGGYGRGELHPQSDVDIMILLRDPSDKIMLGFGEAFVRFLWDIGLEVGHSIRSIDECIDEAMNNITVATNLMEARLVTGDSELFDTMETAVSPPAVWPSPRFFEEKLKEQEQRHLRFDDTAYNLEPNLKDGPGGLRDIQTIAWVAQRHFGTRSPKELIGEGFLSAEECKTLIRARNFLWRLRNGLHYLTERCEDRLLFDYQRQLAVAFGYKNRKANLAVEQLMQRYYRTVKEIHLLNEILLQHFQEATLSPQRRQTVRINPRFKAVDGFLEVNGPKVFENYPSALLELFLVLQQRPELKGVRASTIRLLRSNLHRIDNQFRRNPVCQQLFIDIFKQKTGLTRTLRRMNAYDVLGAYIPVFGRIVGQMQHDLFHVYTVDAHALFVVRNLRRLADERFHHEFPEASAIMVTVPRKDRLYLAGLFHDIAKGRGGDHSILGEKDARAFCKLHNMGQFDANFVAWLVRHHLSMSWTAQKEDISDPDVVEKFAQLVGDQERLDNLYMLTIADMRGTSPTVWNAWKGRLLAELYQSASRLLRLGLGTTPTTEQRADDIKRDALAYLKDKEVNAETAKMYWNMLGDDYLVRHDPSTVAWHTACIAQSSIADLPIVAARHQAELGGTQFLIFAAEAENLLVTVAGGFDRMHFNIADARIHPIKSGMVLLAFVTFDQNGKQLGEQELLNVSSVLKKRLLDPPQDARPTLKSIPRTVKQFPTETSIRFSDAPNGSYTIMELVAQDRPGLIHRVAQALVDCKIRLQSAKISTFGERAEDVFFITNRDGEMITDANRLAQIEQQIRMTLDSTKKRMSQPKLRVVN